MQIAAYVEALVADLHAVAAVGNAHEGETVRRITAALESSLRLRLLEAVAEAAHELTPQLPGHVEVRLAGGDPSLVYVEDQPEPGRALGEDALSARITLRLPGSLKGAVEAAAARDGVSVNTWLVQALTRAVDRPHTPRTARRLSGFARS